MTQLGIMTAEMQGRLTAAEDRLTDLALVQDLPEFPQSPLVGDVAVTEMMEWMELPIDDRRDYVRRICNIVLLSHYKGSARVFDRDTVQVVLKTRSSPRGLLPAEDIKGLIQAWRDAGILPADGLRTFNHPSPVDGRRKKDVAP